MTVVDRISAVLPVSNIATAEAWYRSFFGRAADATPRPTLLEWHEGSGGIAVLNQSDRTGMGYATIHVDSIEAHRAALAERGLTLGPAKTATPPASLRLQRRGSSRKRSFVVITLS